MKRTMPRLAFAVVCFATPWLNGCSSEGGVVGSGVSSVQGNIADVQLESEKSVAAANSEGAGAAAEASLPAVTVSIDESPGLDTTTDAEGTFLLQGDFAGTIALRFRTPGSDTTLGTLVVEIGAGATVVLPDIQIRADLPEDERVQVRPPLYLSLFGLVSAIDCGANNVDIEDESPARNHFLLRLSEATEIVDAADRSNLTCDRIRVTDRLVVEEGVANRTEGLIEAIKLRVQPTDSSPPPAVRVRRRGTVLRTACESGIVHFQDTVPDDLVSARLTSRTAITCGLDLQPCQCADIQFGDLIAVVGIRRSDQPRAIEAGRVLVLPNPTGTFILTTSGDVVAIDCAANSLRARLREIGGAAVPVREVTIRLTEETVYRCVGDVSCTCEDVRPSSRVKIVGLVNVDQTVATIAREVSVLAEPRARVAGTIVQIDCATGRLVVRSTENARVTLQAITRLAQSLR